MNPLAIWKIIQTGLGFLKNPWVWCGILALVVAVQSHRLSGAKDNLEEQKIEAKQELSAMQSQRDQAIAANETNQATIKTLQDTNAQIIAARALDEAKAAALLAQREDQITSAKALAASEKRKRVEVWNASQSCQALAVTRVDDVCGPIADKLRERTSAHSN